MKNPKILAIKKVAGRKIPFEMDFGLVAKITEKYQCRLVDLLGKEITLDETETWEHLRINMLKRRARSSGGVSVPVPIVDTFPLYSEHPDWILS